MFGRFIAIAVFLAIFPVTAFVVLSSPEPHGQTAQAITVENTHRICPVDDCSDYPKPADIRGTTIATLQNWVLYVKIAKKQIRAMKSWNSNTVRLQIQQDRLVHVNGLIDHTYLRAVRTIVHTALKAHLYVVLNAQTELAVAYWRNEPLPTKTTYMFWRVLTNLYGDRPHVIFDLFNEPRAPSVDGHWTGDWRLWHDTFQSLVGFVRRIGSRNQLWVEGESWGSTLEGVPLLQGQGIVYSVHHPGCPHPWQCPIGPATWQRTFGYLHDRGVQVVDGEYVNYLGGYYWPHSTRKVTEFFGFLHKKKIGVVSWTLQPGVMTTADLRQPMREPISAGAIFMKYYQGKLFREKYMGYSEAQSTKGLP